MFVELDFPGKVFIIPVLLNVDAFVDVVTAAVHPVDCETVDMVVGVLDIEDAAIVVNGRVPLEDGVALAHDGDVGVGTPRGRITFKAQPR